MYNVKSGQMLKFDIISKTWKNQQQKSNNWILRDISPTWINIWVKSGTTSSSHSGHLTCITRASHFSAMFATLIPTGTTKEKNVV